MHYYYIKRNKKCMEIYPWLYDGNINSKLQSENVEKMAARYYMQ